MPRALPMIAAALMSVACVTAVRLAPVTTGSAADPHSPEPPPTAASPTLRLDSPSQNTAALHAAAESGGQGATTNAAHREDKSMPSATVYTCPMHPEVRSDQPGTCPKCGMKLVPAKPAPDLKSHK